MYRIFQYLRPSQKFNNYMLFIIFLLVCLIIGYVFKFKQYSEWKKNPSGYFVNNTPMMTTQDSYLWLRYAGDLKEDKYYNESTDKLRNYPHGMPRPSPPPLLSILIAKMSYILDSDVYRTSLFLNLILSGLFGIPLMLYFFRLGMPVIGMFGYLTGSFSTIYYIRTSIGKVDTDSLNLFFPFLISYLILLTPVRKKKWELYLFAAMVGIIMLIFLNWYSVAQFSFLYLFFLFLHLYFNRIPLKTGIICCMIYLIFPFLFIKSSVSILLAITVVLILLFSKLKLINKPVIRLVLIVLILIVITTTSIMVVKFNILPDLFSFPRYLQDLFKGFLIIFDTGITGDTGEYVIPVAELKKITIDKTLSYVYEPYILSIIGLLFCVIFIIINIKHTLPIIPSLLIGLVSLNGAIRYGMYLAPFIGIGFGYLLVIIYSAIYRFLKGNHFIKEIAIYISTFILFILIINKISFSFIPRPAMTTNVYSSLLDIKKRIPQNSVILNWWDRGYAIQDILNSATFHDNGFQYSDKTILIANAFSASNQVELYKTSRFLFNGGDSLNSYSTTNIDNMEQFNNGNLFILFTHDLTTKFRSISNITRKDRTTGKTSQSYIFGYLNCKTSYEDILSCRNNEIDLRNGIIKNKGPLKRVIFLENGRIPKVVNYKNPTGLTLEIIMKNNKVKEVYVFNDLAYNSNFNQMFFLGVFDPKLFELVYDNFPDARLFRVALKGF